MAFKILVIFCSLLAVNTIFAYTVSVVNNTGRDLSVSISENGVQVKDHFVVPGAAGQNTWGPWTTSTPSADTVVDPICWFVNQNPKQLMDKGCVSPPIKISCAPNPQMPCDKRAHTLTIYPAYKEDQYGFPKQRPNVQISAQQGH